MNCLRAYISHGPEKAAWQSFKDKKADDFKKPDRAAADVRTANRRNTNWQWGRTRGQNDWGGQWREGARGSKGVHPRKVRPHSERVEAA